MRSWRPPPDLARLAARWQAGLAVDPEPPSAFLDRVLAAGVRYGDRPLCTTRQPMLVDRALVQAYQRVLADLRVAVRAARELLVADGLDGRPDSLAVRIGVTPAALELARLEPSEPSAAVLARFDSLLCQGEDGAPCPQLIELNAEAPTGMAYDEALGRLFLADPLIARLDRPVRPYTAASAAVAELVGAWRRAVGTAAPPRVAIVDRPGLPTAPEFELFRRAFAAAGVPCAIRAPAALHRAGGRLRDPDGVPIDLVYRRLLVADLLADPAPARPLVEAVAAGEVAMVNTFRSSLLHGKGLLALLHDPLLLDRLPVAVAATVRRNVPWTGLLLDRPGPGQPAGLRARVAAEPERWVLKPLAGQGGAGVLLGWECGPATWRAAVEQATAHVVQARVPTWEEELPEATAGHGLVRRTVGLDPQLVRGELVGFLCRLSRGPLLNVHEGATEIPVLQVG